MVSEILSIGDLVGKIIIIGVIIIIALLIYYFIKKIKPYWLKGGLIGIIIGFIFGVGFEIMVLLGLADSINSNASIFSIISFMLLPITIITIIGAVIGAIIGLIIGKFKNKTRSE